MASPIDLDEERLLIKLLGLSPSPRMGRVVDGWRRALAIAWHRAGGGSCTYIDASGEQWTLDAEFFAALDRVANTVSGRPLPTPLAHPKQAAAFRPKVRPAEPYPEDEFASPHSDFSIRPQHCTVPGCAHFGPPRTCPDHDRAWHFRPDVMPSRQCLMPDCDYNGPAGTCPDHDRS